MPQVNPVPFKVWKECGKGREEEERGDRRRAEREGGCIGCPPYH